MAVKRQAVIQIRIDTSKEDREDPLRHHRDRAFHRQRTEVRAEEDAERDEQRGADVEVAVLVVLPRAERADGEEERAERGAGRGGRRHPADEEQRRNDDDPAADAEQPRQEAGARPIAR